MSIRTFAIAAIILSATSAVFGESTAQRYELRFAGAARAKGDSSKSTFTCGQKTQEQSGSCRKDGKDLICSIELPDTGAWSCVVTLPSGTQLPSRYDAATCMDIFPAKMFNVTDGATELQMPSEFRIDSTTCTYVIDEMLRK